MATSSQDIVPLPLASARLMELCEEVQREHCEKSLTKNGKICAALIDIERLDYYHRLEREHVHLTLIDAAIKGLDDVNAGRVKSAKRLRAQYGG